MSTEAFLRGQGIPIELSKAETELTKLWGPASQQVADTDKTKPTVTRLVLSNLVVFGRYDCVEEVLARHPSRMIALTLADDPSETVHAEVSAVCHLPAPGQPQVCSERIALFAGDKSRKHLPAAVRSLLESDLPVILWWSGDPQANLDLFESFAKESSRILLDFPYKGARDTSLAFALSLENHPYAQDLAWFKITPWRNLIAQRFDPPENAALDRIQSLEIHALSPVPGPPPRLTAWLAAWIAGQLGWKPVERETLDDGSVLARFESPAGHSVQVKLSSSADPSLQTAQLAKAEIHWLEEGGTAGFQFSRPSPQSPAVHLKLESPNYCSMPQTILAPEISGGGRVCAALEASRDDPPYQRALPHALWLMS